MGVTYKLREEVVHFIISQRQSNPLASCRQLAESASQKFGLHLSKSSVHDVLKESGITTPRGRKPKIKFEIPQEKKQQIQDSLSQVKLLPDPAVTLNTNVVTSSSSSVIAKSPIDSVIAKSEATKQSFNTKEIASSASRPDTSLLAMTPGLTTKKQGILTQDKTISPEYEGAGRVFLKAVLWDLGIFSEENIKAADWNYYLTYAKGVKVAVENNRSFFIDLPLPLERCIREIVDGLVNNVKSFIVYKVSDEELFKACMEAQAGFKINSISIVDYEDHILLIFNDIVEFNRRFILNNRVFVDSNEINLKERMKAVFFTQLIDNNEVINNILNLKGFDTTNKDENIVTICIADSYEHRAMLQEAMRKLNAMYLRDEQGRLVSVSLRAG